MNTSSLDPFSLCQISRSGRLLLSIVSCLCSPRSFLHYSMSYSIAVEYVCQPLPSLYRNRKFAICNTIDLLVSCTLSMYTAQNTASILFSAFAVPKYLLFTRSCLLHKAPAQGTCYVFFVIPLQAHSIICGRRLYNLINCLHT